MNEFLQQLEDLIIKHFKPRIVSKIEEGAMQEVKEILIEVDDEIKEFVSKQNTLVEFLGKEFAGEFSTLVQSLLLKHSERLVKRIKEVI